MSIVTITRIADTQKAERGTTSECTFTITDATGSASRIGIDVRPGDSSTAGWFKLSGATERDLPADGTVSATVQAVIPADAAAGTYPLSIRVYAASNPEDSLDSGPVKIEVAEQEGAVVTPATPAPTPGKKPWWILWVSLGVLGVIVLGVVLWLVFGGPDEPPVTPVVTVPNVVDMNKDKAKQELERIGLVVTKVEAGSETPIANKVNTVYQQVPAAGLSVDKGSPASIRYHVMQKSTKVTAIIIEAGKNTGRAWGGKGGGSFTLSCPNGQAAIGIHGASGTLLDKIGLRCNAVRPKKESDTAYAVGRSGRSMTTPTKGGRGGGGFNDACRDDTFVIGLTVRSGTLIDRVSANCAKPTLTLQANGGIRHARQDAGATPPHGGRGGSQHSMACPNGTVLSGLYGRSGNLVDNLGIRCSKIGHKTVTN